MKGWIEIFKSGTHTSSSGTTKTWTNDDLDKMASSYSSGEHEAPVVVGHPKDNDPAYGWLESAKRVGSKLLGQFKQVAPEFSEMVKDGRFKKRSISVYPDGTIRHVGFLGAQPPAIKGLKDIAFSDKNQEAETYEYGEEEKRSPEKKGADMPTEKELALQKELDAEKKKREKAETDAAANKTKSEKTEADFAEHLKKAREKETADFIETGIKDGKILPAWKERGLATFMDGLEGDSQTFEFSEGKKETRSDWFKNFISSFSEHPLFKEMAKPESAKKEEESDFAEEEKAAEEMAAAHRIDS